ncbi:MAG: hypothetical protein J0H98_08095 [Solirubrobacterales bacterium]|nr:hypothetical protein [Solirubrobacterales bacterium]
MIPAGEVVTCASGRRYRPVLDAEGKVVVQPTRDGDLFLARSKRVRVVKAGGGLFIGLRRQILEPVPTGLEGLVRVDGALIREKNHPRKETR